MRHSCWGLVSGATVFFHRYWARYWTISVRCCWDKFHVITPGKTSIYFQRPCPYRSLLIVHWFALVSLLWFVHWLFHCVSVIRPSPIIVMKELLWKKVGKYAFSSWRSVIIQLLTPDFRNPPAFFLEGHYPWTLIWKHHHDVGYFERNLFNTICITFTSIIFDILQEVMGHHLGSWGRMVEYEYIFIF